MFRMVIRSYYQASVSLIAELTWLDMSAKRKTTKTNNIIQYNVLLQYIFMTYSNIWVHKHVIHPVSYHGTLYIQDVKLLFANGVSTFFFYK